MRARMAEIFFPRVRVNLSVQPRVRILSEFITSGGAPRNEVHLRERVKLYSNTNTGARDLVRSYFKRRGDCELLHVIMRNVLQFQSDVGIYQWI